MNNPNDLVQAKHLDSLAAQTAANMHVLKSDSSTVEGAMWFEVNGDAPVIKFVHDGKEFTFSQNSTPVTNVTRNGSSQFNIGDRWFKLTGFYSSYLTLFNGKFYANNDTDHQNPIGSINARFDGGKFLGYDFHFNTLYISEDCELLNADTVSVRQLAGAPCDYRLTFAQGDILSPTTITWSEERHVLYKRDTYYVAFGSQSVYVHDVSGNQTAYVYNPLLIDEKLVYMPGKNGLFLNPGSVSDGTLKSGTPFELKTYDAAGELSTRGIASAELVIHGTPAFEGGQSTVDSLIANNPDKINIHLKSLEISTNVTYVDGRNESYAATDTPETFTSDGHGTYEYVHAGSTSGFYTGIGSVTAGRDPNESGSQETMAGHLLYRTADYGGDTFSITGLVDDLTLMKDGSLYTTLTIDNSTVCGACVGRITADETQKTGTLAITDMRAIDTAKIGDGGQVVLSCDNAGHIGIPYKLSISSALTDTQRAGYCPPKATDLGGGRYKFSAETMPDYIAFDANADIVIGGTSAATSTATFHAAKAPETFTISGLSAGLGALTVSTIASGYRVSNSAGEILRIEGDTVKVNDRALPTENLSDAKIELFNNDDGHNYSLDLVRSNSRKNYSLEFYALGNTEFVFGKDGLGAGFYVDGNTIKYAEAEGGQRFKISGLNGTAYTYSLSAVTNGYSVIATSKTDNDTLLAGSISFAQGSGSHGTGVFTLKDTAIIAGGDTTAQTITFTDSNIEDNIDYSLAFDETSFGNATITLTSSTTTYDTLNSVSLTSYEYTFTPN